MRILTVCDSYPFPLTNGQNLRIYHYVKRLRHKHKFDLLCYGDPPVPEEIRPLFEKILVIPIPKCEDRSHVVRWVRQATVSSSHLMNWSAPVAEFLEAAAFRGDYDLFWFSGGGTMNYHIADPKRVAVFADVVDDPFLAQLRVMRRAQSIVERVRHAKRLVSTYLFERKVFRNADVAAFVAEDDAAMFSRICYSTVTRVVHNGVDESYFVPLPVKDGAGARIVFEGNMGYEPNVEAAEYLCRIILPLVRSSCPDVEVDIVGRDPASRVLALQDTRVNVTGFVDDIRDYLRRPSVFACPMLSGAGIKNKILQAWAMGLPTVATSLAVGGLDARDGENILLRDDPREFARALVNLLTDSSAAQALGDAGRRTVLADYCWSAKAEEFDSLFVETRVRADARLSTFKASQTL
jgi:polysaccharide biosynthesis protein PslH